MCVREWLTEREKKFLRTYLPPPTPSLWSRYQIYSAVHSIILKKSLLFFFRFVFFCFKEKHRMFVLSILKNVLSFSSSLMFFFGSGFEIRTYFVVEFFVSFARNSWHGNNTLKVVLIWIFVIINLLLSSFFFLLRRN